MSANWSRADDVIARLFPLPDPKPIADCAECWRLVRVRLAAREKLNLSAVSDANVLLRKHQCEDH